jgi:uncharacterized protein YkwD
MRSLIVCFFLLFVSNLSAADPIHNVMLAAANRERDIAGAPTLRTSQPLTNAAQWYADFLHRTRQQGHYAYGMPWDRARAAGFTGTILFNEREGNWYWTGLSWKREIGHDAGEVLCFGGQSVEDALDGWMKSAGHRAAVLEPSFDVAGFGQHGTVWVGMLGNSTANK